MRAIRSDTYTDSNRDGGAICNGHSDANGDSHRYIHAYAYSLGNRNSNAHPDANTYAAAW